MQCYNCGSQLPEGVAFCQQCGAPVSPPPPSLAPTVMASPPPAGGSDANYNPLAPTVAASQPPSGGSDANYDPLAPTVAASQPSYGNPTPYTNYNPSSVPGSGQSYETVQNPYSNVPYGQSQSGNIPPYGQPQSGNVPSYASPPPGNMPAYTPPAQNNNASYGAGMPAFASPVPVKRKSKVGLIVGIVIAVLLIACVGSTFAVISLARTASQSNTVDTTSSVVTPTPVTPSGNGIDPTASSIVTNIQTASAVDPDTYQPTTLGTSFQTNTDIYISFKFDLTSANITADNPGYVEARYYTQNRLILTSTPLKADDNTDPTGYGYFTVQYYHATTTGAAELYWCRKSDCADKKLAGMTTFTVS